jgi:two-component system, NtrC family, sensor histidine kinase HydH
VTTPSRIPIHWTRVGLLATTVVMAAGLVLTGVSAYRSAGEASEEIVGAQALDLKRALWREMARADGTSEENLAAAVAELEEQGLRYAALIDPDGAIEISAGESITPLDELPAAIALQPHQEPVELGERIRVVEPFRERRGRSMRSVHKGGFGADHREEYREGRREERREERRSARGAQLIVLEFEPVLARSLRLRATTTLVTSSAAAAVLLLFAAALWRQSNLADRQAAELARDRHLAALGEMSAVLNHEIRNPLASLKGHAQLMLEKLPDDHDARPKAQRIVREALRLEELTGHVLDFARSGNLQRSAVDPAEVARAAAEQVDAGRVEVAVIGEPPPWSLDRERMEQVLANVIRNGVQASPEETVVQVGVQIVDRRLCYTIRDRGEGLPAGEEGRIFEPFYTQRVRGTGLGLALAQRIVEGHGGTIAASNHPDGGARFRIEIPEEA